MNEPIRSLKKAKIIRHQTDITAYDDGNFELGFIQCLRSAAPDNPSAGLESSIAFPIFVLDRHRMRQIESYRPQKMLEALQVIISACTHDTLHHYTNVYFTEEVAAKIVTPPFKDAVARAIEKHEGSSAHDEDPRSFEMMLVGNHADTQAEFRVVPEGEGIEQILDLYFSELQRIAGEMARDTHIDPESRNKTIDYFSTAATFSLARIAPLHDPLMRKCLDAMERVAPAPLEETWDTVFHGLLSTRILDNYATAGLRISNKEQALKFEFYTPPDHYRGIKIAHLIHMLPGTILTLSPAEADTSLAKARQAGRALDRDVLMALSGFLPSAPK